MTCLGIFIDYDKSAITKKKTNKHLLCLEYHGDGVMVEWGTTLGKGGKSLSVG